MKNKTERIEWIDMAKGLAIILVGVGHYQCPKLLNEWIYAFHMPLFFILSGYTFSIKEHKFNDYLIKKTRALILPWLGGMVVYIIFNKICIFIGLSGVDISFKSMIYRLFFHVRNSESDPIYWFLPCLFLAEIILFFVLKICKTSIKIIAITIGFFLISGIYHYADGSILMWEMDLIGIALIYLLIGYLLKEKQLFINKQKCNWCIGTVLIGIGSLLTVINLSITKEKVDFFNGDFGMYLMTIPNGSIISISIILLAGQIRSKSLSFIGRNSLLFYILQPITYKVADLILCICLPLYSNPLNIIELILLHSLSNALIAIYIISYRKLYEKIKGNS